MIFQHITLFHTFFYQLLPKSSDAIAKLRVIVSEMERRERILTEP